MSSITDFEDQVNGNLSLMGLWFRKLLYDASADDAKRSWIGEEFIKQFTDKKLSYVFLHSKHLSLPIDEVYEMIKKEKEVVAFLEQPIDLDNFTLEEVPCDVCEENNEKIKELQKVQEKQRTIITSNNKLLNDLQTYLRIDVPKLMERVITDYDKEQVSDMTYQTETMNKMDVQYKDLFLNTNKTLIETIRYAIHATMTEQQIKHSLEVNKLQDKVMELQGIVGSYQNSSHETVEKLKKYKLNCMKLQKANTKLLECINEHCKAPLQKVNEDLKEGKILVQLKAVSDRGAGKSDIPTEREQIGDGLQK